MHKDTYSTLITDKFKKSIIDSSGTRNNVIKSTFSVICCKMMSRKKNVYKFIHRI